MHLALVRANPAACFVAHVREGGALHVEQRTAAATSAGRTLDFVRER